MPATKLPLSAGSGAGSLSEAAWALVARLLACDCAAGCAVWTQAQSRAGRAQLDSGPIVAVCQGHMESGVPFLSRSCAF